MTTRLAMVVLLLTFPGALSAQQAEAPASAPSLLSDRPEDFDTARRAFYNADYDGAAMLMRTSCETGHDLAACELRTTALLFQIRRAIGDSPDADAAWKRCAVCPSLFSAFMMSFTQGAAAARARLQQSPDDDETLFLLGKLNLNYVWLQVGTLGRRTGLSEYREARRSLERVLARQPTHVRARVARGWIDYIVGTKMRAGTRWILGGGNKKRGLSAVRTAAATEAEFFAGIEARFALWDMQVRERDFSAAVNTARLLQRDFPHNPELKRFVEAHPESTRK